MVGARLTILSPMKYLPLSTSALLSLTAVTAHARNHLAFVAQQIFRDIPAAIELTNNLKFGHDDIIEKVPSVLELQITNGLLRINRVVTNKNMRM